MIAGVMAVAVTAFTFGCGSSDDDAEAYYDEYEYAEDEFAEEEFEGEDTDEYYEDYEDVEDYAEEADDSQSPNDYTAEEMGITFHLPDEYFYINGVVDFTCQDVTDGDGVYYGVMDYTGVNGEEFWAKAENNTFTEADAEKFEKSTVPVFTVIGASKDMQPDKVIETVNAYMETKLKAEGLSLLKEDDNFCFYGYNDDSPENYGNLEGDYKAEFDGISAFNNEILQNADYKRPLTKYEKMVGNRITFTTKDINGNDITSDEIFSQNKITMVNVWATWCGWCVGELPELEQINKELEAMDCGIVGLCGDATDDSTMAEARSILNDCGVTYTNICPYAGWDEDFEMSGWPTSFFVDSNGQIVTTAISGAKVNEYKNHIEEALNGNTTAVVNERNSYENSASAYRVIVADDTSAPVEGAMVQFCTDDTCKMALTDANGVASFDDPPGVYDIHVRKLPPGYKQNNKEYRTEPVYSDMVIMVERE